MGLLQIQTFEAGPSKSGISISQGETGGKTFFRIGLTLAAQMEFFGRKLDTEKDAIALTVTDDPKHLHLMGINVVLPDDPKALPLSGGIKDSIALRVATWKPAQGKHPAAELKIINRQVAHGGISVKLPEWARPAPDRRGTPA